MKFIFEKLLTDEQRKKAVSVDGAFDAALQISHWPGNSSPPELKADTATEMAFNLIESERRDEYLKGIEIVSNNHFDTDGLLACYVLLYPDETKHHKGLFIDIATTGDFGEFTSEEALKIEYLISTADDPHKTILEGFFCNPDFKTLTNDIYLRMFKLLPELINDHDKYEKYWKDYYLWYKNSEASFVTQTTVFSNYGDCQLSIIESDFKLHPVSKFSHAKFDIVLSVTKNSGGHLYELEYKNYTWFDTKREKKVNRGTFEPLVDKLNHIESKKNGFWKVLGNDPASEWDYRMQFSDEKYNLIPSGIRIFEIEGILFEYFFE
ncbi:MAG: hypothetical protein JW995_10260 [Melioribacteraceae bacterium]|nr:hypothetical protein [Melioribacteraceae bacterium]